MNIISMFRVESARPFRPGYDDALHPSNPTTRASSIEGGAVYNTTTPGALGGRGSAFTSGVERFDAFRPFSSPVLFMAGDCSWRAALLLGRAPKSQSGVMG